mmetsp:Transcript_22462/g.47512  ORF Transcript_22462/g.47512 Transcript_22462/m.47512 type:complete len:110 (-) Transcript_22462:201-530(-)
MSRSFFITFFIVVLGMMSMDQAQGLAFAGIVNRVTNNSIWGKCGQIQTNRQTSSLLPVQAAMVKQEQSPSSSMPNLPPQSDGFSFDPDSYRREMTDLVYERNMQRMFNK